MATKVVVGFSFAIAVRQGTRIEGDAAARWLCDGADVGKAMALHHVSPSAGVGATRLEGTVIGHGFASGITMAEVGAAVRRTAEGIGQAAVRKASPVGPVKGIAICAAAIITSPAG